MRSVSKRVSFFGHGTCSDHVCVIVCMFVRVNFCMKVVGEIAKNILALYIQGRTYFRFFIAIGSQQGWAEVLKKLKDLG